VSCSENISHVSLALTFTVLCGIKFLESKRFAIQGKTSQIKLYTFTVRVSLIFGNLNFEGRIFSLAAQVSILCSMLINNLGKGWLVMRYRLLID